MNSTSQKDETFARFCFAALRRSVRRFAILSDDCTFTVPAFTPKYSDSPLRYGYYPGMLQEPRPAKAEPKGKILLYGNSILIAGLSSKLGEAEGLEVTQMEDGALGDLSGVDVIVVDLRDVKTPVALPRLSAVPNVALVGLDALTNTVTVLTGQPASAGPMQNMLNLLKEAM